MGPANAARPPSRAIATAAFAAQPPLTTKNPFASALASGPGNSSTRKTSSSTMMPVQSTRGVLPRGAFPPAASTKDIRAFLDITADNVVGDSVRHGRGESLRVLAQQHQNQLFAVEPARVFKLAAVDDDVLAQRFGVAAYHQRHRKGPRLRSEIIDAAADDADFLEHFSADRFLDRLTRFDKAGKAGPHRRRKARRAAEHATFSRDRQHDRDWIGAGKMLHLAGWAIAPPTGFDHPCRRTAVGTETVAPVPAEHRLGLGQRRQMVGMDQAVHRDRTNVSDFQIIARLERLDVGRIEIDAETRGITHETEEHRLARGAEAMSLIG